MQEILEQPHGRPSGWHIGQNKAWTKSDNETTGYVPGATLSWCQQCDTSAAPQALESGAGARCTRKTLANHSRLWPRTSQVVPCKRQETDTNFCHFGVPRELHSNHGPIFEYRLMQHGLQRLWISKTQITLHPQSDDMESFVNAVNEHLKKVTSTKEVSHLPARWQSTNPRGQKHDARPATCSLGALRQAVVCRARGSATCLPMRPLTTQLLPVTAWRRPAATSWCIQWDSTKETCLDVSTDLDQSGKFQISCKGPSKVITRINNVVCQIQCHPRAKMMAVHPNRQAP
jgi:hypothetical protein